MASEKGQGAGGGVDRLTVPTLTTPALVLRQLILDDAAQLHNTLSDDQVMRYWSSGTKQTIDETRSYLAWNADTAAGHKCWSITTDGRFAVGWVILIPHRPGSFELGYILGREYWRRGYLTQAASVVIDYAFGQLGVRRIMADSDPENLASVGLLKKLGFRQEGRLREEWETHIGIRDSLIFGLLREEWFKRRP